MKESSVESAQACGAKRWENLKETTGLPVLTAGFLDQIREPAGAGAAEATGELEKYAI
jgi:hypothetical protein